MLITCSPTPPLLWPHHPLSTRTCTGSQSHNGSTSKLQKSFSSLINPSITRPTSPTCSTTNLLLLEVPGPADAQGKHTSSTNLPQLQKKLDMDHAWLSHSLGQLCSQSWKVKMCLHIPHKITNCSLLEWYEYEKILPLTWAYRSWYSWVWPISFSCIFPHFYNVWSVKKMYYSDRGRYKLWSSLPSCNGAA